MTSVSTEQTLTARRTVAHTGGQECVPCLAELRRWGVRWWEGCELHGISNCLMCHRHPGQCNFGSCVEVATTLVTSPVTNERRRMCESCADLAELTGWVRRAEGCR